LPSFPQTFSTLPLLIKTNFIYNIYLFFWYFLFIRNNFHPFIREKYIFTHQLKNLLIKTFFHDYCVTNIRNHKFIWGLRVKRRQTDA
jgi:hypothetical protein